MKTKSLFIFFIIHFPSMAQGILASDLTYLNGMPTPTQVVNYVKDKDPFHTYAKQAATFEYLQTIIEAIVAERQDNGMAPEERRLWESYKKAEQDIYQNYNDKIERLTPNRERQWHSLVIKYGDDKKLNNEILNNLLSPLAKNKFLTSYASIQLKTAPKGTHNGKNYIGAIFYLGCSIVSFIFGIFCLKGLRKTIKEGRAIGKDEFGRRNAFGVAVFSSYEESMEHERKKRSIQRIFAFQIIAIGVSVIAAIAFFSQIGDCLR